MNILSRANYSKYIATTPASMITCLLLKLSLDNDFTLHIMDSHVSYLALKRYQLN